MQPIQDIVQEVISQHPVKKLRLEVVVYELLRLGVLTRQELVVTPESTSLYNFEADVTVNNPATIYWTVNTPQVSFYDRLPEQLFHKPVRPTLNEDKFQLIRREEEKQEAEGRAFFLPFDNRLYQYRILIEQLESEGLTGDNRPLLERLIAVLWTSEFPVSILSTLQLVRLIQYLPTVHEVVGNLPLSAQYIHDITGESIEITWQAISIGTIHMANNFGGVGAIWLGTDSALVGSAIDTTYPVITVRVGPLSQHQIPAYLPGGNWRRLLELLLDLLLPVEADSQVELLTIPLENTWLGSPKTEAGLLGYTSHI